MATTAKWGSLEWGVGEWGSIEEVDVWAANGTLALNGTANLTLTNQFAAVGTLALNGTAGLTTVIQMAAVGILAVIGVANLRTARNATTLSTCGHPVSNDCDSWLLKIFKRAE